MGWFTTRHFDGVVKIAGVQTNLVLKSDYDRIWNEDTGEPLEYWHYHFEFRNKKMEEDDEKGIKTMEGNNALPEYDYLTYQKLDIGQISFSILKNQRV